MSSAVACVQLAFSIRYGAVYVWMGGGTVEGRPAGSLGGGGGGGLVALINTCRHGP